MVKVQASYNAAINAANARDSCLTKKAEALKLGSVYLRTTGENAHLK